MSGERTYREELAYADCGAPQPERGPMSSEADFDIWWTELRAIADADPEHDV